MKEYKVFVLLLFVGAALDSGPVLAQEAIDSMEELLRAVREQGAQISAENRRREQEFLAQRDRQKALLDAARAELRVEEEMSQRLKLQFDQNEQDLEDLGETLRIRLGDMGELFGIVRQVAGDTKGIVEASLVSAQYADRGAIATKLAQARELPSIADIRALQALLLEEMVESGKVVRFMTNVEDEAGHTMTTEVVRVGVFNAITEDKFLRFDASDQSLQVLSRQPAGRFVNLAEDLFGAGSGHVAMAVDPSRGAILGLVIQSPTLIERISQGGLVGYAIIVIGAIGFVIALLRLVALVRVEGSIKRQLSAGTIAKNNPLGRVLAVYADNRAVDTETIELKLDEAILKETPQLEQFQGIIKVFAAVAPLLGLLGTVVGMIKTFQSITLFGTGDPKLMAGGISQALVTTVEGLVVAIPLVFLHALVSGKSRAVIEVLEEQSAGMVARHAEQRRTG